MKTSSELDGLGVDINLREYLGIYPLVGTRAVRDG